MKSPLRLLELNAVTAILALWASFASAHPEACQAPAPVQHPLATTALHLESCSKLSFAEYPPTSGDHYDVWAKYRSYNLVLSPGYWLHSAEHGAVIFLINCHTAGSCAEDRVRLQRIADAFPADPLCDAISKHRIIIAGDTVISTRFAAVAWGWSLESDCLDSTAFAEFLKAHYAHAPENLCGGGTDFPGTGWCTAPMGLADPRSARPGSKPGARNPNRNRSGQGTRADGRDLRRGSAVWRVNPAGLPELDPRLMIPGTGHP